MTKGPKQSFQKRNQEMRQEKSLKTYDRYQKIWFNNLDVFEHARDRQNRKEQSINYKFNQKQKENDFTLQDRTEHFEANDSQMSDVFEKVFQANIDKNAAKWQCSLRQNRHDHVYDGVRIPLKMKSKRQL